jgi:Ribbon-helix-helix domain
MLNNQTRWTVSVSKETDRALRGFLTERGMKKGDISKFIEEAVKKRIFEQTLAQTREKLADIPCDDLQAMINEACQSVRDEMRCEFVRGVV